MSSVGSQQEPRVAGPGDADGLVALVESAYRGDSSRAGWTTEADLLDGQRVDAAMMAETLNDPVSTVLLIDGGGSVAGCCEVRRNSDASASFGMFAVDPSLQGSGLGRRLLAAAERFAVEQLAAEVMTMDVIEQRRELIDWYCRRGYEPTGETREFPYEDERYGRPRRDDLRFVVLAKALAGPRSPRV